MLIRSRGARLAGALLAALTAAPLAVTTATTAVADEYPTGERINPAALPAGPATPLLRVVGRTIIDGSTRIEVAAHHVRMVGRSTPDYLVMTSDANYENWRLLRVTGAGATERIAGGPRSWPEFRLSDGGAHVALLTYTHDDKALLRVVETATGDVVRARTFPQSVSPLDFGSRRMVLGDWGSGRRSARTYWWNPFSNRTLTIAEKAGYIADISADRFGFFTKDPYLGGCQKVMTLSRPRTLLWRSCDDVALSFSPNGKRIVSTYILTDGPGPGMVQVRGARGRVLDTYRARWFGFVKWETDRRLVLQVGSRRSVAAVRCTLESCERVSKLFRTGEREPWMVMPPWSFAPESLLDR